MSFPSKLRFPDEEDSEQGNQRDFTTQHSSECSPENSKNPASEPDFDDLFPESLYDNIEEFLDSEGLFLSTKSPILTCTTLKPSVNIKRMNPLGIKISISQNIFGMSLTQEDVHEKALPGFLARRAISAGLKLELDV